MLARLYVILPVSTRIRRGKERKEKEKRMARRKRKEWKEERKIERKMIKLDSGLY